MQLLLLLFSVLSCRWMDEVSSLSITSIYMTSAKQFCYIKYLGSLQAEALSLLANSAVSKLKRPFCFATVLAAEILWRYKIQIPDCLSITCLISRIPFKMFLLVYPKNQNNFFSSYRQWICQLSRHLSWFVSSNIELKAPFLCNFMRTKNQNLLQQTMHTNYYFLGCIFDANNY